MLVRVYRLCFAHSVTAYPGPERSAEVATDALSEDMQRWARRYDAARVSMADDERRIDVSRRMLAQSLELLDRTERQIGPRGDGGEDTRFEIAITLFDASETVTLQSIADLIGYIRSSENTWAPLRDEAFVAAALPSTARTRALRALAIATFRSAGIEAL